jgi:transcription elongation factor GreA
MTKEKKFYLTKNGLGKIKQEYQELQRIKNLKANDEVPSIFHSEDINPEYLSYQEDLILLENRLSELENILKNFQLIKIPPKEKQNVIGLGAKVLVEVDGQNDEFEIVGTLEANPSLGKISNESPVGQALLGRRVEDEVVVSSSVRTIYKIKKIRYLS